MSPKVTREAYAAVYISAPWHRKVLAIPESDRVAAFGFYAATLALCQSYRNDGHLPAEQLAAVIACPDSERKRLTDALTAVHLFDKTPAGIQVHDFLDHNSSREEIEAAHKVLVRACEKMENEVIKANRDHLANNRVSQFSNAGLADEWYALGLEQPRVKMQRQRHPGQY